jgi:hypothetical protein
VGRGLGLEFRGVFRLPLLFFSSRLLVVVVVVKLDVDVVAQGFGPNGNSSVCKWAG